MSDGIVSYGLNPPEKLLLPRESGRKVQTRQVKLRENASFARHDYLDGTFVIVFDVPCDEMPHCHSCECSSQHSVQITEEQAARIRELL